MKLLFPTEEEIMNTIWNLGKPCVISDILKSNPSLKRNTVAKVLLILEQKGYLSVDSILKTSTRTGRAYKPIITQRDYQEQKRLMNILIDSDTTAEGILNYCSALADTREMSKDFIDEIEQLINDYKNRED